jgi:hypothetical protein
MSCVRSGEHFWKSSGTGDPQQKALWVAIELELVASQGFTIIENTRDIHDFHLDTPFCTPGELGLRETFALRGS